MQFMLAMELANPLFWGVLVAWILTVVLHEFAHGLVAWLGGDYTIRERGGLSLNPLQYIDPVFSILMPAVFLLMGGIPLPGGATYIRKDLLRSKLWCTAVAAAGPAMNLLIFLLCVMPFHPRINLLHADAAGLQDNAAVLLGTLGILQLLSVVFNLVPIPPLDGFQMISPYLPVAFRNKVGVPPVSTFLFVGFFIVLWKVPDVFVNVFLHVIIPFLHVLGFDASQIEYFASAFNLALFGQQ